MLYAASAFTGLCSFRERSGKDARLAALWANTTAGELPPGCFYASDLHEALSGCDLVILPIPLSRDHERLNAPFHKEQITLISLARAIRSAFPGDTPPPVFAGAVKESDAKVFAAEGIGLTDYSADPLFALENAAYSAEGALAIAIENTAKALKDCRAAIFGYGKTGRRLCALLTAAGAKVMVFQRKESDERDARLAGAEACGYRDTPSVLPTVDLLFNTVPDPSIASHFPLLPRSSLVIELAGIGVKDDNLITALSIPSKYSPESAGRLICRTVSSMLPAPPASPDPALSADRSSALSAGSSSPSFPKGGGTP